MKTVYQLQRDPFARATLIKTDPINGECAWCGNSDGNGKVWDYYWEPDTIGPFHVFGNRKHFCSKSCWQTYK